MQFNPMRMLQMMKQNPLQMLQRAGYQIPQGMAMTDPNAIINYLQQSGQLPQERLNQIMQSAQQFRR
jgi:hypothetical protein